MVLLLSETKLFCADNITSERGESRGGGQHCQANNILQAYNLIQLVWIATTKLEEATSQEAVGNTTYPSILVPPSLDPGLVLLYNNITMVINVLVILSCLCAGLAICKVIKSLRAFAKTNVPQTAGLRLHSPSSQQTVKMHFL